MIQEMIVGANDDGLPSIRETCHELLPLGLVVIAIGVHPLHYTPADLDRAQRRVDDGERRLAKQRDMLAEYCRLGFPMEGAVETLASALYRLDQMRRHRDEIWRHIKPDHSAN